MWLFGSRVDDTKRSGDIDLYIETECNDISSIYERKKKFIRELEIKIGEQKIDVVINRIKHNFHIRIYDVARETGVQLV